MTADGPLLAESYAGDESFIKKYLSQYFCNFMISLPGAAMSQCLIELLS